jgi:pSer/pThr/pTyr-binding forkhead associated (FHA) protein
MVNSLRLTLSSPTENFTYQSNENSVRIGRSTKCEFNIPREDLSREHCLLEVEGEEYFITDLGSKNGIAINRMKIAPNVRTKVTEESLIVLSNIYTLKINAFEVKSKMDMVSKKINPDMNTVTFALDLDEIKEKKPSSTKRVLKKHKEDDVEVIKNYDTIKMAIGFIVIVGFVIYHALGR